MPSVSRQRRAIQTGDTVLLRRPTARDEEEYFALRRASAAFLRPWEPKAPKGADKHTAFRRMLAANRTRRCERLLVCSQLDGRLMGCIAINEIVRGAFQCGFLGYWIGAAYARRGYMTEALELMLRHAFGALGLHRVEANIMPHNRPSIRLVTRAGFRQEGLSKRYLEIAGCWQDHERWALLREEFQGAARRR
jgi:[ribosomal protein S5]-alanine N-acetyltransferase